MRKTNLAKKLALPLAAVLCASGLVACSQTNPSTTTSEDAGTSENTSVVVPGKTKVELSGPTAVEIGKTVQLTATVYGPDANVSYKSSDETIATVDATGNVKGVTSGFVTITATSTYDDTASATYTLFVEPGYISSMVSALNNYDVATGVSFTGTLDFANSSANNADGTNISPFVYNLALKTNATSTGVFDAFDFDFLLSPNSSRSPDNSAVNETQYDNAKSLMKVLGYALNRNMSITAKDIGVSYLGDGNLNVYQDLTGTSGKLATFKQSNPYKALVSTITSLESSDSAESSSSSSESASSSDSSLIDWSSILSSINLADIGESVTELLSIVTSAVNSMLVFDSNSVYMNSIGLSLVNSLVTSLRDTITNDAALSSYASIINSLLPEQISDVRFTVNLDDDGSYTGFSFKIVDNKKASNGATERTAYNYISLNCPSEATVLSETYFTTAKARAKVAANDVSIYASLEAGATTISNAITDFKGAYNAINFSNSFENVLKAYNTTVYPLINDVVNDSLYPTDPSTFSAITLNYGPYASFSVSDNGNVLAAKATAYVGAVYTLSDIVPVGSSLEEFATAQTYSVTGGSAAKSCISYDANAKTITVNKLPSGGSTTITITSGAPEGYTPISYVLNLPKA